MPGNAGFPNEAKARPGTLDLYTNSSWKPALGRRLSHDGGDRNDVGLVDLDVAAGSGQLAPGPAQGLQELDHLFGHPNVVIHAST